MLVGELELQDDAKIAQVRWYIPNFRGATKRAFRHMGMNFYHNRLSLCFMRCRQDRLT